MLVGVARYFFFFHYNKEIVPRKCFDMNIDRASIQAFEQTMPHNANMDQFFIEMASILDDERAFPFSLFSSCFVSFLESVDIRYPTRHIFSPLLSTLLSTPLHDNNNRFMYTYCEWVSSISKNNDKKCVWDHQSLRWKLNRVRASKWWLRDKKANDNFCSILISNEMKAQVAYV